MAWIITDNGLLCEQAGDVAVSKIFQSKSLVRGMQYATQQTDPIELVPNDDFTTLDLSYEWTDTDQWHVIGDAWAMALPEEHAVTIGRSPQERPVIIGRSGNLVQEPEQPVFSWREISTTTSGSHEFGGLSTPLVSASSGGVAHAAIRFTANNAITNPLLLQIVAENGYVVAEKAITAQAGQLVETWVSYTLGSYAPPYTFDSDWEPRTLVSDLQFPVAHPEALDPDGPTPTVSLGVKIKARIIQRGESVDSIKIDRFSIYEEPLVWEFSNNGGATWVPGYYVRNNAQGIIRFSTPSNALRWRLTSYRPGFNVSALQIRPWYVGIQNARQASVRSGPNVSSFDSLPPIDEDPAFKNWDLPIPRSWFINARRYPVLTAI